jgi:hypothetical protein
VIIYFIICSLIISPFLVSNSSAYEITYKTLDNRFDGNLKVCAIEFEYDKTTQNKIDLILDETKIGINEWQVKLQQKERGNNNDHSWKINYELVPLDNQQNYNYSNCGIIIDFKEIPDDEEGYYEVLGTHQSKGTYSQIDIFYKEIEICETRDKYYIYYNPCYGEGLRTIKQIGNVVRHEFGHALGLDHYEADDKKVNSSWAGSNAPLPSIMVPINNDRTKEVQIRDVDVEKVFEIYPNNGFLGNGQIKSIIEKQEKVDTKNKVLIEIRDTENDERRNLDVYVNWDSTGTVKEAIQFEFIFTDNDNYLLENVTYMIQLLNEPIEGVEDIIMEYGITDNQETSGLLSDDGTEYHNIVFPTFGTYYLDVYAISEENYNDHYGYGFLTIDVSRSGIALFQSDIDNEIKQTDIPTWIKNNSLWYGQDMISDTEYIQGIQFLINNGILEIPINNIKENTETKQTDIPTWIKNNSLWYGQDMISDTEYIQGIQFLINNGILEIK